MITYTATNGSVWVIKRTPIGWDGFAEDWDGTPNEPGGPPADDRNVSGSTVQETGEEIEHFIAERS